MTKIIDGTKLANELLESLRLKVAGMPRKPHLAAIIVGDDPASQVYIARKEAAAKKIGITTSTIRLDANVTQDRLLTSICDLNYFGINGILNYCGVDGILLQLPLPKHIDQSVMLEAVDPKKDVDGFHPLNLGRLGGNKPFLLPCTPMGIMRLLEASKTPLAGASALVIGRSVTVGLPTALLLNQANATVTIAHSHTKNTADLCKEADIVIVAIGRPNLIRGCNIKKGATIIDVGINRLPDGKIVGDVDYDSCLGIAGAITPVPGGVGPMTVACLMENTVQIALSK